MGSIVTKDYVAGALTTFRAAFTEEYNKAVQNWPLAEMVMMVQSQSDSEDYSWLGDYPAVREFLGDAHYNAMVVNNFNIPNKEWESTVQIDRKVFEDDAKLGTIRPRINNLASNFLRHKHKLLMELIIANGVAYDGVAYFATTHAESGSNQSNLLAGTGTTTAQVTADFRAARSALAGYQTDTGEHFNSGMKLIVLAPTALWGVFEELEQAGRISDTDNVLKGSFQLITTPYLESLTSGDVNDWYLLNVADEIKPFIMQDRRSPELNGVTDPSDGTVVKSGKFAWQGTARYNTGFGLWQRAVKTTNT